MEIYWILVGLLVCYAIYLACKAGAKNGKAIRNVVEKNADEYDERHKKKEEKKGEYNVEDEKVKKVFKELEKSDDIDNIAKKLNIKKNEVYKIKLFLEDEGLL